MNHDPMTELRNHPAYQRTLATSQGQGPHLDLSACLLTAKALQEMEIPKRVRMLGDWLCQGDIGYIFAPRGVGKTWLAMSLPMAISQGQALGEWQAGERRARVLYVDGEMPLELTQYRCRGLGLAEGDISYLHHERLFNEGGVSLNIARAEHREAVTQLLVDQGFECLILDNLSSLASGVDENKGNEYEPIGQWLLELRRRGITSVVIHHAGRNGFMRGHTKKEDICSWILELRDAKTEGDSGAKFISHFAKPSRNTGQPLADLQWHFTSDERHRTHVHCEKAQASEYEQFIQHVHEGVDRQTDIADLMDKPRGTICKWMKKALAQGRIRCRGNKLLAAESPGGRPRQMDEAA